MRTCTKLPYIWLTLIGIALAYSIIDVNVNGAEFPALPRQLIFRHPS